MSQSIEFHGPGQERNGLAEKARKFKDGLMRKLSGSGMEDAQTAQEQVFDMAKAEGDGMFSQLQQLGRINFFSYTLINDILSNALKNPEEMVKVRLNVMKEGLKQGRSLTEEEWGKLAMEALQSDDVKMWLNAHPIHKN